MVQDSYEFALAVEGMIKETLGISPDEKVSNYVLYRFKIPVLVFLTQEMRMKRAIFRNLD